MSTNIASKNLYELLGNDPELDPDRPADPPTKVIDKPVPRTGKRNAGVEAPARDAARPVGAGRGDRDQGAPNNRGDRRDDGTRQDRPSTRTRDAGDAGGRGRGRGRGRGGRGGPGRSFRDPRDDRHSHTGVGDHEKQAAHGWGNATDGQAEWTDEAAGDAIAKAEEKQEAAEGENEGTATEDATPAEPEEKTKSYDEYLAEQAEKRLALGSGPQTRKANEGSKQQPSGTEFSRKEEDFFVGSGGKQRKEKELKQKDLVVIDGQYYAPPESSDRGRGGRGGARGGRGGRGGERGRGGRGRGESRGDLRGGSRGTGGARGGFNANDQSAFPALGA